ncbi:MAG: NAD(P)-dependent alcohol dehydrogenase [Novosphingobium sp.]|nr:NAD(P)-dependent alcohol dehydrogenase [Novosphingobium sp.]
MSSQWVIKPGAGVGSLLRKDVPDLQPAPHQVLVKMRAASLNFRDLLIIDGLYPLEAAEQLVPLSDGAGEVVAVGSEQTRFKIGDRVAGIFTQSWMGGEMVDADLATALGGSIDGVLSEYRLFDATGLVHIPDSLTFAEGATLPCAAVTAWNALMCDKPIRSGQTVLILGTGGVAIFALQLARAAGARVIITSSSDEKLERARALGANETINYRNVPEWGLKAKEISGGEGVDMVVETGGPGTLAQSLAATRRGGSIQMIGVLSMGEIDPLPILTGGISVRGIMVGSREMFDAMNKSIEFAKIKPVIDREFAFGDVPQAFEYLRGASHMGKIVINIG